MAEKAPKTKTDSWFDVKTDFNAVGDGVVDDTDAIKNAFNAAKGKGILYFPPGIYLISSAVAITFDADISVEMSPNAKVVTTENFDKKMFQFLSGTRYNRPRFIWTGGTLDASKIFYGLGASTESIWVQGAGSVLVEKVVFLFGPDYDSKAGDGFSVIDSEDVTIRDCWFYGAPDSAIYITGASNS